VPCFEEKTADALIAGALPAVDAQALRRHAEGCRHCTALLERVRRPDAARRLTGFEREPVHGPRADRHAPVGAVGRPTDIELEPVQGPRSDRPAPVDAVGRPTDIEREPVHGPRSDRPAPVGAMGRPTDIELEPVHGPRSDRPAPADAMGRPTDLELEPVQGPRSEWHAPVDAVHAGDAAGKDTAATQPLRDNAARALRPATPLPGHGEGETRPERSAPRGRSSSAPPDTGPEARERRQGLVPKEPGADATVGRYQLLDILGSGGMGVVYGAHDPELNRRVAIKLLHPQADPEVQADGAARLLREAQAMARLAHPNVVAVYDAGTFAGRVFITMELVEGLSLRHWLRAAHRTWREVLALFRQAGRGLAAAHAAGLVHRDFKPANVLVNKDGRVQVTDFGLARNTPTSEAVRTGASTPPSLPSSAWNDLLESPLTQAGLVMGTPAYMPPEQHEGLDTDARGDQFSFCASLYEALYGQLPFEGNNAAHYRNELHAGRVRPPPRDSRVPAWLLRALSRGLAPVPEERYPSMEALLDALGRDPAVAWRRRGAVAAGAVLLAGAVGVTAWVGEQRAGLCSGAEARLAGVWDDARRAGVQQAFNATGSASAATAFTRVATALDGFAREWAGMHREACEATRVRGHQSDEVLSLRMACLDRRRSALGALVGVLAQPDARLLSASQEAVQYLPPVSACADVEALRRGLPESPEQRQRVEALRAGVDRATALVDTGRYAQARDALDAVLEEAETLGYAPVLAEAMELEGRLELALDEEERARAPLYEAFLTAHASRHDALAARAAARLVTTLHSEPGLAPWSEAQARATLERLGHPPEPEALLETSLGRNAFLRGDYARAAEAFGRAAALREKALGAEHLLTLEALRNQAGALSRTPETARAESLLRRVLESVERVMGPDHPQTAYAANAMGFFLVGHRRAQEAVPYLHRAIAVEEQALGADSATLSYPLNNLAAALEALGRHAEARPLRERALALDLKSHGPHHLETARDLALLSGLALREGQPHEAVAFARRSLEAYAATQEDHPDAAAPLMALGEAWLALGDSRKALPPLERALALRQEHPGPAEHLAATRFAVARALPSREASRARTLAGEALDFYAAAPDIHTEETTRVRAWLKARGRRR
jgi:tetratricopeptide (TPR) repeat protein